MKRTRTTLWLAVACAAVGCADQTPPPPEPSFERPGDVAFVCLRTDGERHVPERFDANDPDSPCANRRDRSDAYAMHALVTQTTRGEVAVVNLETGRVRDSRRDVPGYTFVPVGEFPSAIIVPPNHPEVVYVANFGSRDIYALSTSTMIDLNAGESAVLQVVPVRVPMGDDSMRGGPKDMVLSPSGDALLVAVPELSTVLRMPIRDCVAPETECILSDQIQAIPMGESLRRTLAAPAPPADPEPYQMHCGDFEPTAPSPGAPPELPADLDTIEARPYGLAVDPFCAGGGTGCAGRVFVADAALPLIHVIDLAGFDAGPLADPAAAVIDPWVSGAPTLDVAVTPRVPRSIGASGDDTQYVYAIDNTDATVLVMQDGVLLHPGADPSQRPDRVPLGRATANAFGAPRAMTLEVVTPRFDETRAGDQYLGADECGGAGGGEPTPRRLSGVFLTVATSDGLVFVVDVHDMELAPGPGAEEPCRRCPTGDAPLLVRHRPRLADNYLDVRDDGRGALSATRAQADLVFDGRSYRVRPDGTSPNPTLPDLACIACSVPLLRAFPESRSLADAGAAADPGEPDDTPQGVDGGAPDQAQSCPAEAPALICATGDPWLSQDRNWTLTYEGAIPFDNGESIGHRGQFRTPDADASKNISGTLEFISELDFCKNGVIGDDDAPEGVRGDALLITAALPDKSRYPADFTRQQRDDCAALRAALDDDPDYRIRFGIRRAYRDYLVLEERTLDRADDVPPGYDTIVKCMNGRLMTFQVQTRDAYRVQGSLSGFQSPTVATGPSHRCVPDPDADPLLQGRAVHGRVFRNRFFELLIQAPRSGAEPPPGANLVIQALSGAAPVLHNVAPLADDPSIVPAELRYLDIEERLFLVDSHQLGLVPIGLDPLQISSSVRYN